MKTIYDSLLNAQEQYICHQCNCMSRNSLGLARSIFFAFPWANTYSRKRAPGTIDVMPGNRPVINVYSQVYPGKPNGSNDSVEVRLRLFVKCLERILEIPGLTSIAFPEGIGCGLAGGNWPDYLALLEVFEKKTKAQVSLYSPFGLRNRSR